MTDREAKVLAWFFGLTALGLTLFCLFLAWAHHAGRIVF